jgi:hypothetical protein
LLKSHSRDWKTPAKRRRAGFGFFLESPKLRRALALKRRECVEKYRAVLSSALFGHKGFDRGNRVSQAQRSKSKMPKPP